MADSKKPLPPHRAALIPPAEAVTHYTVPPDNFKSIYRNAVETFHAIYTDAPVYFDIEMAQRIASMESLNGKLGLNSLNKAGYGGLMQFSPDLPANLSLMAQYSKTILHTLNAASEMGKIVGLPPGMHFTTLDDVRKPKVFYNPSVQTLMMFACARAHDKQLSHGEGKENYLRMSPHAKITSLYYMHNVPEVGKRLVRYADVDMPVGAGAGIDYTLEDMKKKDDPRAKAKLEEKFAGQKKDIKANPKPYAALEKKPVTFIMDFLDKTQSTVDGTAPHKTTTPAHKSMDAHLPPEHPKATTAAEAGHKKRPPVHNPGGPPAMPPG